MTGLWWRDLCRAARSARRDPLSMAVAVISLGLALGACASIFNLLNAVLLRPLPVAEPEGLVAVYGTDEKGVDYGPTSYPDYLDIRRSTGALADLAAYSHRPLVIATDRFTERIWGGVVSPNYFAVLGLQPVVGRFFVAEDGEAAAQPAVVLSYAFWRSRFDADRGVVGKVLEIDGERKAVVIGVAPPRFTGTILEYSLDLWLPIGGSDGPLDQRDKRWLTLLLGRLAPDRGIEEARQELRRIARSLAQAHPDVEAGRSVHVVPARLVGPPAARSWSLSFYGLLLITAALVLAVAVNNLVGIMLARAHGRRRDSAMLLALGAGRGAVLRYSLIESLLLSSLAGIVGVGLAIWTRKLIYSLMPIWEAPLALDLRFDGLTITLMIALLAACAFGLGLAPGLVGVRARFDRDLRGSSGTVGPGRSLWPRLLVISQVPLSLVLLVVAGLLLGSVRASREVDLGFSPDDVLVVGLESRLQGTDPAVLRGLYATLIQRVEALPGVSSATLARGFPFGFNVGRSPIRVIGREPAGEEPERVRVDAVGPHYLETLGIRLLRGRSIEPQDRGDRPRVAVVDETLAARFWPAGDALGGRFTFGGDDSAEIQVVGIAAKARYAGLEADPQPIAYLAFDQAPPKRPTLLVRTHGHPAAMIATVREEIRRLAVALPTFDARPLGDFVYWLLWQQRMMAFFATLFGIVAVMLACLGIYGVIAYLAHRRRPEIAIRLTLGARRGEVVRSIVAHSLAMTAIGFALGLLAALVVSKTLLADYLFGVKPDEPAVFLAASALLAGVASLAAYLPARRAARLDPMASLRVE